MLLIHSSMAFGQRTFSPGRPGALIIERVPLGRAVALRVEAFGLDPDGLPSLARSPPSPANPARDGTSRDALRLAGSLAEAIKASPSSQVRITNGSTASTDIVAALPMPGDRGPFFLHAARERACLPNWTALRSRRFARGASLRSLRAAQIVTPRIRHARSRAAEVIYRGSPARPPRQPLRLVSRRPQRRRRS